LEEHNMGGSAKNLIPFSPGMALVKSKGNIKEAFKTTGGPLERAIKGGIVKQFDKGKDKKKTSSGGGGKDKDGRGGDPMMEYLKRMQKEQNAQIAQAAEAQRQALLQSQMAAGSQAEQMGESAAQQQLATMGSMQSIRDANALLAAQQAQATAGQQATGGGFDFNKSREEALANLGAAAGMLPSTYSNAPMTSVNPALSGLVNQGAGAASKKSNMFSLPSSSDLKFGGV
jgi:hypothetical protein